LWNDVRNTSWENIQLYFGHRGYANQHSILKAIARAIVMYFHRNNNQEVHKSVLCEQISKHGFKKEDIIETVKNLLGDGILYEPRLDMLKLTNYQTSIHDFNEGKHEWGNTNTSS